LFENKTDSYSYVPSRVRRADERVAALIKARARLFACTRALYRRRRRQTDSTGVWFWRELITIEYECSCETIAFRRFCTYIVASFLFPISTSYKIYSVFYRSGFLFLFVNRTVGQHVSRSPTNRRTQILIYFIATISGWRSEGKPLFFGGMQNSDDDGNRSSSSAANEISVLSVYVYVNMCEVVVHPWKRSLNGFVFSVAAREFTAFNFESAERNLYIYIYTIGGFLFALT